MKSLCVIPARVGSKRIPKKNIRLFHGKPIISYSIEAAISSQCFDRIIVSTDDQKIANISIKLGAEVPFLRPSCLSDDFTGTREVVHHAIDSIISPVFNPSLAFCLYATAPFVRPEDINKAFSLFRESKPDSVIFPGTLYPFPIQRALSLDKENYTAPLDQISISKRSQDLDDYYHDAGQFYLASVSTWKNNFNIFNNGRMMLLPKWRVQDIDNLEDWSTAELLYSVLCARDHIL